MAAVPPGKDHGNHVLVLFPEVCTKQGTGDTRVPAAAEAKEREGPALPPPLPSRGPGATAAAIFSSDMCHLSCHRGGGGGRRLLTLSALPALPPEALGSPGSRGRCGTSAPASGRSAVLVALVPLRVLAQGTSPPCLGFPEEGPSPAGGDNALRLARSGCHRGRFSGDSRARLGGQRGGSAGPRGHVALGAAAREASLTQPGAAGSQPEQGALLPLRGCAGSCPRACPVTQLCSQPQIRDEDRGPPPSAPPLLLSVIPGGFIKQLVRETEQEAKAARRRKESRLGTKEEPAGKDGESRGGAASEGPLRNGLKAEGQGGKGVTAPPHKELPPVLGTVPSKTPAPAPGPAAPAPKPAETPPKKAETSPKTAAPALKLAETPPKRAETPPKTATPAPKPAQTPPKRAETLCKAAETSKPAETSPKTAEASTKPSETTPKPSETTPKAAETPHPGAPKVGKLPWLRKNPKDSFPGGSPPAPAPAPSQGLQRGSKIPVKEGDTVKGTVPESTKEKGTIPESTKEKGTIPESSKKEKGTIPESTKEKGTIPESIKKEKGTIPESSKKEKGTPLRHEEPPAKVKAQRELLSARKEPEKMKKDVGGDKKEPREIKKPEKATNKSEGLKGEPGGIQEKSTDVGKEVGKVKEELGKGKEMLKESKGIGKSTDKDQAKETSGGSKEMSKSMEKEQDKEASRESTDKDQAPRDVWYEAEKVWLIQQDGFTLATQLKPDVGTPELPAGRVRVRRDEDGTVTEVDEDSVQRTNPPSLDQAEDLATLVSLNECSVLNTLRQRFRARLPCTYAGPSLVAIAAGPEPAHGAGKVPRGKRDNLPPHICSLAHRAYRNLLLQRHDQAIIPLGHSGAGRTRCCQRALEYLVGTAGSLDGRVSVEKIQAMFTVLGAFGSVTTSHSSSSTRFSMVLSLDFSATGQVTAAHLQTLLLERARVAQQPEGESSFNVFPLLLAGLDVAERTMLHLHQVAESNSFGIKPFTKPEDKQRASVAFSQLRAAMGTLGITAEEQAAVWRVLAGIYHLGAAGACKVGRKQFLRFESASRAAEVLGCDVEELGSAVFKHHLRHILAQVTARGRPPAEESPPGPKMTGVECVEGMASGLYEELFAALVSLINRSFSSQHLSMASIAVVDSPGFQSPRQQRRERAATFEELCHNYVQERLQGLFYEKTFLREMERYREENVEVSFDLPERSPLATLSIIDLSCSQQPQVLPGSPGAARRGLLWILDEEVLVPGSGDGTAFERLCSYFATKGPDQDGEGHLRRCEQTLHFEICHQLGTAPVRYDLTGWVSKAKFNLSAQNAIQVLENSTVAAVRQLAQPRASAPPGCRALAGLDGRSQPALHRNACLRKTFASSFAAVRKRSVCAQIKLQADALTNLLRRSQLHFVHCLLPGMGQEGPVPRPPAPPDSAPQLDVVALRTQLEGSQLLDALRLHRVGYSDRLLLTQFRRRFQLLAPEVMKKHSSAYEVPDESKAIEELFQALDLEKKSVAIGRTQVFLKPGVMSRLEKQRDKLIAQKMTLLQAACKGFLSRQKFKRLKIQRLAIRCIQKNLQVFQAVRHWPWWQLLSHVRPLLSVNLAEEQLRAKEEELAALRRKLEKSEQACSELRQTTESLESKIIDLTTELSDERYKGDVTCQALDGERAERLRGTRELQELQSKHDQVQKKLESVEKQLEEAQQLVQLREMKISGSGGEDEWQVRFDCAQTEIVFLRKRLAQLEERLEAELGTRTGLEQKLGEARAACQAARDGAQRLRRRCQRLACELEDARLLAENQQSRSHELEKRQKKFDLQLAQALGQSAFEKSLREKLSQENTSIRWEMGKLQQSLEHKEAEVARLEQQVAVLAGRVQELSTPGATDTVPTLKKKLWDLEGSAAEQKKELERQTAAVDHLEQLHERLELEIERMKQIHQKELEDKDEELEDMQKSCQKRLRQLEMQLEQEHEQKQMVLHEKQDLEGLIGTLCEQIGHRDFDVEKRLRRDLRRTRALLADVQLLLAAPGEPGGGGQELEHLRQQLEESEAKCAEAQRCQQAAAQELENLHTELETLSRSKTLVDEQLFQLQHERADLLKRIDEDQEDLNELMEKHKALIAQSATDIAQIRELQTQVEDVKKEKQSLQEKLQAAQARAAQLEQCPAERAIVSRQEARIRDLESQLDFQAVQMKRFEVLVLRLRDSIIQMGEELEKAAESEARERENTRYYQRRMEEMKADMDELVQRELESSRRRMELEQQLAELAEVRQGLQADLGTSIRRIADLQVALEGLRDSDDSDADSARTARESLCSRRDTDACSSVGSVLSLEPAESVRSWPSSSSGWTSLVSASVAGSVSAPSVGSRSTQSLRVSRDAKDPALSRPLSSRSSARPGEAADPGRTASPLLASRRREYGKPQADEELESPKKPVDRAGDTSPAADGSIPSALSPPVPSRRRLSGVSVASGPVPSSAALSEYVEELRRQRAAERDLPGLGIASPLPIYRTTGAAALRRSRAAPAAEEPPGSLEGDQAGDGEAAGASLTRSSSLRSMASEPAEPPRSPALKKASKFGSYDSLLPALDGSSRRPSSPAAGMEVARLSSWRSCLEPSLEDVELGKEPEGFLSSLPGDALGEGKGSDPFSWRIPTLNYERRTKVDFDDFLPAIRKSRSASSLARARRDRRDGQRPLTVRFEDEAMADLEPSETKGTAKCGPAPREEPGELSDCSSSSGSQRSSRSADSIKRRPQPPRGAGEGSSGRAGGQGSGMSRRAEAEGREDDVSSIMKKYLGKE
ncbi:unconventional myosin-XVIIIb [Passer domesticus]|uniref:unconventional myosin-XVIIIb n=1 Tax=Passer domesticus TaxID=48849 RepID=UPI0030FEDD28